MAASQLACSDSFQSNIQDYLHLFYLSTQSSNFEEEKTNSNYIEVDKGSEDKAEIKKAVKVCFEVVDSGEQDRDYLTRYKAKHIYTRERMAQTSARVAAFNTRTVEPPAQISFNDRGYASLQEPQRVAVPITELTLYADSKTAESKRFDDSKRSNTRTVLPVIPFTSNTQCSSYKSTKSSHTSTNLPKLVTKTSY